MTEYKQMPRTPKQQSTDSTRILSHLYSAYNPAVYNENPGQILPRNSVTDEAKSSSSSKQSRLCNM